MSESNHRCRKPKTVHHLTSRIAHRVFFLKEEQRNDFMELMMGISEFTGIVLLGWCIMSDHFHILAYLPEVPDLTDEEVMLRYKAIRDLGGHCTEVYDFDRWRTQGEYGARMIDYAVTALKKRMYSIPHYMQMLKQWFTENYNAREGHKGTMWEATYHDRVIEFLDSYETRKCLAYVHLNPIRAAITPGYGGYCWCSFSVLVDTPDEIVEDDVSTGKVGQTGCAKKWRELALTGMRMVYGEGSEDEPRLTDEEMIEKHRVLMDDELEGWKLQKAKEIAGKRAAGYNLPPHPLTSEAMIAQAREHLLQVQDRLVALRAEREITERAEERRRLLIEEIKGIRDVYPNMPVADVASLVGLPIRTVYRYCKLVA